MQGQVGRWVSSQSCAHQGTEEQQGTLCAPWVTSGWDSQKLWQRGISPQALFFCPNFVRQVHRRWWSLYVPKPAPVYG